MPLYEYKCLQCNRHTEKIQKFSDAEITICPHCGGTLERVITAPAIAFKGGGWYADGYGNAKPAAASDGNSAGTPAAENKADAKPTESKSLASEGSSTPAAAPAPVAAPASSTATPASGTK